MLAGAGTGTYRVKRAMQHLARRVGIDELHAAVTMTSITMTARRGNEFRTVVREISSFGVDAGRIAALERLAKALPRGVSTEEIKRRLNSVDQVQRRWPDAQRAVAAGLGCAAFAILNGFSIVAAIAVVIAAGLGQLCRGRLARAHVSPLFVVAACSAVSCLLYLGLIAVSSTLPMLGPSTSTLEAGFVAAVLYLIPGFPLFTALLDIAHLDVVSGSGRLIYSLAVIGTSTGVVWMLSSFAGVVPVVPPQTSAPLWMNAAIWGLASLIGVGGFAILFDARLKMVGLAAMIGAVANLLRLALLSGDVPAQTASFAAGLSIGLLATLAARWGNIPRITVSVPASIIMVPGTALYRAMYYLNAGSINIFLAETTRASLLMVAIGGGLALARFITDPSWAFHRPLGSGVLQCNETPR